ncbi:MAG TPA: hypothetical protein P5511_07020, partial [Candidatus Goldiibacteriota bacterium]|nr:hypothetical protein [Candidatus Goldiibacteriota bacterium]
MFQAAFAAAGVSDRTAAAQAGRVMKMKINGSPAIFSRYETGEKAKKVIEQALKTGEMQGMKAVNNETVLAAANAIFRACSAGKEPDSFGYVFLRGGGKNAMTIAAGYGKTTEVITAEFLTTRRKAGANGPLSAVPGAVH